MKIFKVLVFRKITDSIRELMDINYYQAEDKEQTQKYAASILENNPNYSYIVMEVEPKDIVIINNYDY